MYWIVPPFVKIKCLSIVNQINIRNISEYRCVVYLDSSKYACLCFFLFLIGDTFVFFPNFCGSLSNVGATHIRVVTNIYYRAIFVLVYSVLHTAYDSEKVDCIFEYGNANAKQKKAI